MSTTIDKRLISRRGADSCCNTIQESNHRQIEHMPHSSEMIRLLESNYLTMAKYVLETMGKRITNIGIYIDALIVVSTCHVLSTATPDLRDAAENTLNDNWWFNNCRSMLYYCGIDQYQVLVLIMKSRLLRNFGSLDLSGGRWDGFVNAVSQFWIEIDRLVSVKTRTRINSKLIENIHAKKSIMQTQLGLVKCHANDTSSQDNNVVSCPEHTIIYSTDKKLTIHDMTSDNIEQFLK